jgi:RNA polymerase sigma-70 factor (ECF subfamily)
LDFSSADDKTSATLLDAVGSSDSEAAWRRFVKVYEPMLYRWLRIRGMPDHLATEVLSDVFLKLVGHMSHFVYDNSGSFRGWLRTVTENAANDLEKKAYRRYERVVDFQNPTVSFRCSRLAGDMAEPLEEFLEEMDFHVRLANVVVERVRKRISLKTWEAFYLTEVQGESCEDVGMRLNMKPGSVYVARFRVRNYLRTEAEKMQAEDAS